MSLKSMSIIVLSGFFDKGVPEVEIDYSDRRDGERESWQPAYFPYYFDAVYQAHLQRMWDRVQVFIKCLSTPKREGFVGFQVPMGRSGDAEAYPGPAINADYEIDSLGEEWTQYQLKMVGVFH